MTKVRAVLFDLDGTLLDTAADLAFALNHIRKMHGLPELMLSAIKPLINSGSKKMLKQFFNMPEQEEKISAFRELFFKIYEKHCLDTTQFFNGMKNVLAHLDKQQMPWGIVTNRLTFHTEMLLQALSINHLPTCVVCGDTLPKAKPDPAPILHACNLMSLTPNDCVYIGDAATDIIASKAAGMRSLVALYGYISDDENPFDWQADGYLYEPIELIQWLDKTNKEKE